MNDNWTPEQYRDYLAKQARAHQNNKYHNIPTEARDGTMMKSVHEATFYNERLLEKQAGLITSVEYNVRFELVVNNIFICTYELDFRITYPDGKVRYVDTKSQPTLTNLFRIKKQLMLACHGILVEAVFAAKEEFQPRRKKGDKK
jgi:hypothetical protein